MTKGQFKKKIHNRFIIKYAFFTVTGKLCCNNNTHLRQIKIMYICNKFKYIFYGLIDNISSFLMFQHNLIG